MPHPLPGQHPQHAINAPQDSAAESRLGRSPLRGPVLALRLLGHFGARRYSALRSTVARGSANHAPMTTLPQDSTTPRQRLQVVLFDIDGTLLDSNDAHVESWLAALRRHGHAVNASRCEG
jgi:hypothetical protein